MEQDRWILWVVRLPHRVWGSLLAVVTVLVLGQSLLSGDQVLSNSSTDIAHHFLFSRAFGFGAIARGDFPLWNPFTYGGAPYLGQFQSALFYPPNLLFLTLPIGLAMNWSIALHIFLLGLGMYAWIVRQQVSRPASFLAAVALVCGGALFLRVYAGHLSNLCTMAWVPFLFLCIDSWLKERDGKWILLGSLVLALQITAGHPQYVYYTAIVGALYTLVQGVGLPRPILAVAGFFGMYLLAALLGAIQLWPGLRAAAENSRSGGVDYAFASTFSFPPENFLTFLAPSFFGNMSSIPYWGRCYLWEMNAYVGIGILLLAIFGAAGLRWNLLWRPLLLVVITFLLALGCHTIFYKWMYYGVPFYSSFRGTSKFLFFGTVFIVLFAAQGFDRLLKEEKPGFGWGAVPIGVGIMVAVLGLLLATIGPLDVWWQWGWDQIMLSGESYLPKATFASADFSALAKRMAAHSLVISGLVLALFGAAMIAVRRCREVFWLIGIGAIVEVAVFAHNTVPTFTLGDFRYPTVKEATAKMPPDSRILNLMNPDSCLLLRTEGIWGYDPAALKRYVQLLAYSQGQNPEQVTQYIAFNRANKILELLRCKKTLFYSEKGVEQVDLKSDFPRFFLVGKATIVSGRDAVFAAMESVDLKQQVILENPPWFPPAGFPAKGSVKVLKHSNNRWVLQVDTDQPAILVNTDAWSRDWQARALQNSVQQKYQVLPANYAIRAIPLSAGRHFLELIYWPRGWGIAIAVSFISLLAVLSLLTIFGLRKRALE